MLPAMIAIFGGAVLIWTGFVDPPGGLVGAAGRIINGQPADGGSAAAKAAQAGGTIGQISASFGNPAAATPALDSGEGSDGAPATSGNAVVDYAKTFLGTPYKWGGRTKNGFDCAGLVHFVAAHFGHNTAWYVGGQLNDTKTFQRVTKANRRPGDIVFHGLHHVSIYLGNDTVIHSPRPGTVVRIEGNMGNTPGPYVYGRIRGAASTVSA